MATQRHGRRVELFNWHYSSLNLTVKSSERRGPTDCNNIQSSLWSSLCVCELNICASKRQSGCACIHLRVIDWKGESYNAALSLWFQPLSDFLIISQCQCHHQVEELWSLGWAEVKAINSWLQGAGRKSQSSHHGAHHQAARIHPSGTVHMTWGSLTWTRSSHSICHLSAPLSCTALGLYMMLYNVIQFKTFTVAIEGKHQAGRCKHLASLLQGKPQQGSPASYCVPLLLFFLLQGNTAPVMTAIRTLGRTKQWKDLSDLSTHSFSRTAKP